MANNGKQGERLFSQRMSAQGYIVNDVTLNPTYWYKDIDFFCTNPATGNTRSFECKWDACINRTGNLYLEMESRFTKQAGIEGQGWFKWCEADFLAYGDAVAQVFYVIPMDKLKERLKTLPYRRAQCGSDSVGQLVALKDIIDIAIQV